MQAIILAAGMGKRLGELTKGHTKCMVKVNGETLISRLLHQLDKYDLSRIVIVIGYKGDELEEYISTLHVQTQITYVRNNVYDKTNNIYSLYLAKDYLEKEDTLLFESDIIVENSIIEKLVKHHHPDLAVVDKFESWMDGTMVQVAEDGHIASFIPKSLFQYADSSSYYKTVNVYKFSQKFSMEMYVPFLEAYCRAMGRNEYYEQVLRVINMVDNSGLHALPLNGEKWYEIDDIQDLDIAESIFSDKPYESLCSRYGGYWRYPHVLDYCYLVNPYFPDCKLITELNANVPYLITQYPSGQRVNTLLAAKNFHVRQEYILLGNGAAELIEALSHELNGRVGIIRPTFEEYPNRLAQCTLVPYHASSPDFHYTADDLISFYGDKRLKTLVLINPDNPSGNYIPYEDCLRLIEWCEQNKITIILDESFIDFSEEHPTFIANTLLETHRNLVVIKSISKSYGVPGLRLGVLVTANAELMHLIRCRMPIWNINSFAEYFMQIFGKYEKKYWSAMTLFRKERSRFMALLQKIDYLRVIYSEANFVLCEVRNDKTSRELADHMLRYNAIMIKDCSSKCDGNYIRLAIRNTDENNKLLNALNQI